MRKRLIISLLVVNAIVLAACGSGSESHVGPRQILVGGAMNTSGDAKVSEGTASDMPAYAPMVTYVASEDLLAAKDPSGGDESAASWEFVAPADPVDRLQDVVDAIGIGPGVKVVKKSDVPDAYTINVVDGPMFFSYRDPSAHWWSYSAASAWMSGDVASSPPCAPDVKNCGGSWTKPAPTENLPGVARATKMATSLLKRLNVDTDAVEFTASTDEIATRVSAVFTVDGVPTPMAWSFEFGENAELTGANGPVFSVHRGDRYPLITIKEAVTRLNSAGPWGTVTAAMERGMSVGVPTGVAQTTPIHSQIVSLVSVRVSLTPYRTGESHVLMLPAWEFVTDPKGTVEVVAVPETYFIVPDVAPTSSVATGGSGSSSSGSGGASVEPSPVPDGPASTPTVESAGKLVGLSEQEAQKVAESLGWTVRVGRRDGVDLMLTQEFNPSRVNVAVEKGIVTGVLSIS